MMLSSFNNLNTPLNSSRTAAIVRQLMVYLHTFLCVFYFINFNDIIF